MVDEIGVYDSPGVLDDPKVSLLSAVGLKKSGLKAAPLDSVQKPLRHLGNPYLSAEQLTELEIICTYLFSKKNYNS